VLGREQRAAEPARDLAGERGARAAERDDGHVAAEVVGARGLVHGARDLVDRRVEQRTGGALGRGAQLGRERGEGAQRDRRRRRCRRAAGRHEAERVRRARRGEREQPAVVGADRRVGLGVAVARGDELERRAVDRLGVGEARVGQPRDVCAARAALGAPAALEPPHRATRRAHHPAVDGADRRRLTHDLQRAQHRAAALDDRDVRRRAAALEDDALSQT